MTVPMTHEDGPQETFNILGATANGMLPLLTPLLMLMCDNVCVQCTVSGQRKLQNSKLQFTYLSIPKKVSVVTCAW